MHILPQKDIFTIIRQMNAKLIEVMEDNWAGEGYISNTFIALLGKGSKLVISNSGGKGVRKF